MVCDFISEFLYYPIVSSLVPGEFVEISATPEVTTSDLSLEFKFRPGVYTYLANSQACKSAWTLERVEVRDSDISIIFESFQTSI